MNGGRSSGRDDRPEAESEILSVPGGKLQDRLRVIRRLELACALALTLLIVFLHAHRVARAGALWRDEVCTINAATFPSLSQVWSSLIYESFPMLYYLVVRLWAATAMPWWGSGDTGWRVLGALIGIGCLLALWLTNRLLGQQAPILSLVLFGLNAAVISWGDTLRGYGLGALLIVLVYGLVWKVLESPTPRRVVVAALVSILSVQCLYQNAFLLLAICLGGLVVCLRKRMWKGILVFSGIGAISPLSLLPYLPTIRTARSVHRVADVPQDFSQIWDVFATALGSRNDFLLWTWVFCGGISLVAAGYFVARKPEDRDGEGRLDLALFSVTILVSGTIFYLLFLRGVHFLTQPWYYIALMGCLAVSIEVLVALMAATIPGWIGRLVIAVAVAYIAVPITWQQLAYRQTNVDIVAAALQERASAGDTIVLNPWVLGTTFQRYYRGETGWIGIPPIPQVQLTRFDLLQEQMTAETPLQPLFDAMENSLRSGNRVWFAGDLEFPPEGQVPPSLPPAPNGPGGWSGPYYLHGWTLQLGDFLRSHALKSEPVNLEIHQPVHAYEDPPLLLFQGWRP